MAPRDPLTYPRRRPTRLDNLGEVYKENTKKPPVGVTQGGSSRRNAGAKSAATDGLYRLPKPENRKQE